MKKNRKRCTDGAKTRRRRQEHRMGYDRWVRFLERRVGVALLGRAPLRAVVAEWLAGQAELPVNNWSPGVARDPRNRHFGVLARHSLLIPAADNRVGMAAEPDGHVRLTIRLAQPVPRAEPCDEFTLYADADGDGGIDALDALATLATGVLPVGGPSVAGAEPFPRPGVGPLWSGRACGPDWVRLLPLPYAERFLRLPYQLLAGAGEAVVIRIGVGREAAGHVARALRRRLFVNHLLLGNRAIERIEPDAQDGAEDEELELEGRCPVLLELEDVDTGHQYYDHRYALVGTDPARLVALTRRPNQDGRQVKFFGPPVPRRRLRVAYLRALDWRGLTVRPNETILDLNRDACLRVRTAIHPAASPAPLTAQVRRSLLALFSDPARPQYPTPAAIARAVRRELPDFVRAAVDDAPTANRPLGMTIVLRALPGTSDRFAYPTWVVGVAARPRALRTEVARLFPAITDRIAHRLGGAFGVILQWLPEEVNDE